MNKVSLIVLSVVVVLVILSLGGGAGVLYQTQKDAPQIEKLQALETAVKGLSSKIVPSVVAFGEVSEIEGRNITLTYNGDSVTVAIKADAQISSFVAPSSGGTAKQTIVQFGEIKNGDKLSINTKVLPDGQLQGESIMIFAFLLPVK